MNKKIYVVNDYDSSYAKFWRRLGPTISDDCSYKVMQEIFENPQEIGLVCFTGGDDVSPELYGHQNLQSHNSVRRDAYEGAAFRLAEEFGIPMTGICRGAQFLNVMCGGTMVQHLKADHGGGRHTITTIQGENFGVTSSHHQMIVPGEGAEILGWADKRIRPQDCVYDGELPKSVLDPTDPEKVRVTELIAYPGKLIVGCQSHPEWQDFNEPFPSYMLDLIRKYCFGQG